METPQGRRRAFQRVTLPRFLNDRRYDDHSFLLFPVTPVPTLCLMSLAACVKSLGRPSRPLCSCLIRFGTPRGVSEVARLPVEDGDAGKRQAPAIPQIDLPHAPYLPPLADDGSIKGIPYPRGEVQLKPVFQWDTSLSEKENLRREKVHEKWRKRSPYATAELYAHHEPEPYAATTKVGLMAAGAAFFLVILAYMNAGRLRAEAQRREVVGGTPPERPPKRPRTAVDAEGEVGDATLTAFPLLPGPDLQQPGPVGGTSAAGAPARRSDEATDRFLAALERGNRRLV